MFETGAALSVTVHTFALSLPSLDRRATRADLPANGI